MQINGQGLQGPPGQPTRWRGPLDGKPVKTRPEAARSREKNSLVESGNNTGGKALPSPVRVARSGNSAFGASPFKGQSVALLGIIILMHAAVLYLFSRSAGIQMPAVSVPMMVRLITSNEQVQEKPSIKPIPKPEPRALADKPVLKEQSMEEAQNQVIPARFDVAHLNNPQPDYPLLSKRLREQGEVILRVYVTSEGSAGPVEIHTSSGYSRLDNAAKRAVERWRFMPARKGDRPVDTWVLVPIRYSLKS